MSRPDHELANCVLRDALLLACDRLPADDSDVAVWRAIVERTGTEDDEENPPFSEHARNQAWSAWCEVSKRFGDTRPPKEILVEFRAWWWGLGQMRVRGVVFAGPERLTPEQQDAINRRYVIEDDD